MFLPNAAVTLTAVQASWPASVSGCTDRDCDFLTVLLHFTRFHYQPLTRSTGHWMEMMLLPLTPAQTGWRSPLFWVPRALEQRPVLHGDWTECDGEGKEEWTYGILL